MGFNWRVSAGAAGAAIILSLIAGAFGGVPFGSLVVRALVGAVVFGAGAVVVSVVVDRYLPDLKQAGASGPTRERSPAGRRVDIVVDEDLGEDGEPSGPHGEDDEIGDLEAEDDDEETRGDVASVSSGQDGPVEALEELDDAEAASLEGLPDIEGLSDGFPGVSGASGASDEAGRAHRSGEDPDMMAKAIRTVLKREE